MAIRYIEKGPGLHHEIGRQEYNLERRDGVWVSDNDAAVQAIIDSYDPLPPYRAEKIEEIKKEANRRILQIAPEWKQRNILARMTELVDARSGRALTDSEQTEMDSAKSLWADIQNVRQASDDIEAEIVAMTDWTAVRSIDILNHPSWP